MPTLQNKINGAKSKASTQFKGNQRKGLAFGTDLGEYYHRGYKGKGIWYSFLNQKGIDLCTFSPPKTQKDTLNIVLVVPIELPQNKA